LLFSCALYLPWSKHTATKAYKSASTPMRTSVF
jgi:hypothetical protein